MSATTPRLTPNTSITTPMPMGRVLRAYVAEVRSEGTRLLRTPGLSIPFLLLPVPIYLFFGVMLPAAEIEKNPALGSYLFVSWCTFAAMGPAMFCSGCTLAIDREAGLFRLRRALPAPTGAWLAARVVVAMACAAVAVSALCTVAVFDGTALLSMPRLLAVAAVMVAGAIPFCALGLFIGAHVSGSAAPAIINVVFLPMLWLSGLFFPLPAALERFVVVWPAFHLNQVAVSAANVEGFVFVPPASAAAVVAGLTVVCGGLAIRRMVRHD